MRKELCPPSGDKNHMKRSGIEIVLMERRVMAVPMAETKL
jgi:hypothetical protein|tara:strand:- start:13708 stop:13827 length:120 start_codon:yes stop_codon:yes gene_type:complete